jgi:hypothetical protein
VDRREISKAIVGIAAATGSSTLVQEAQAQSSSLPLAELGHDVQRFGSIDLTGKSDCSGVLKHANTAAVALYFTPGIYRISQALKLSVPCYFDRGAVLTPDAGVALTIDAPIWAGPWQIFNLGNSAAALAGALQPMNYDGAILTEWFGAGQDGTDDSAHFNSALLAAYNSGCIPVRLLAKTYNIARTVYLAGTNTSSATNLPVLWGASGPHNGKSGTRIVISGAITAFVAQGVNSCNILKAGFRDIQFLGNGSDTAIQLSGVVYYDIERCSFSGSSVGVYLRNTSTSQYTEFCRCRNCWFAYCTTTAVRYTTVGGFSSYNGSGLQDCMVNVKNNQNVVVIDSGSVYNAPMSFQCWAEGGSTLIVNNSRALTAMHGTITVEGGNPRDVVTIAGGNTAIAYAGKFVINSTGCLGGTITQVDVVNLIGSSMPLYGGRKSTRFACTSGTTHETNKPGFYGSARIVHLALSNSANTYDFRAVLLVMDNNTTGGGSLTTLGVNLVNDAAGYGAPSLSFGNDGIMISNANFPPTGVAAILEHTQIGGPVPYNQSASFAFI